METLKITRLSLCLHCITLSYAVFPFIYLNFFNAITPPRAIIYFRLCLSLSLSLSDTTVIRNAPRRQGRKAVSVMCVIVLVYTSFYPALRRAGLKKKTILRRMKILCPFSPPSSPISSTYGGKEVRRNGNEWNP